MSNRLQDPSPPFWEGLLINGANIPPSQDDPAPTRNNVALGNGQTIRALTTGAVNSHDLCGSLMALTIAPALSNSYIRNVLNILRLAEGRSILATNSATHRIGHAAKAHSILLPATRPQAVKASLQPNSTCRVRRSDGTEHHLAFHQNELFLTITTLPARHGPLPVPPNVGLQYLVAPATQVSGFQVTLASPQGQLPIARPQQGTYPPLVPPAAVQPATSNVQANIPATISSAEAPSLSANAATAQRAIFGSPNVKRSRLESGVQGMRSAKHIRRDSGLDNAKNHTSSFSYGLEVMMDPQPQGTDAWPSSESDGQIDTGEVMKESPHRLEENKDEDGEIEDFYTTYADPQTVVQAMKLLQPYYHSVPSYIQAGWERCNPSYE